MVKNTIHASGACDFTRLRLLLEVDFRLPFIVANKNVVLGFLSISTTVIYKNQVMIIHMS